MHVSGLEVAVQNPPLERWGLSVYAEQQVTQGCIHRRRAPVCLSGAGGRSLHPGTTERDTIIFHGVVFLSVFDFASFLLSIISAAMGKDSVA